MASFLGWESRPPGTASVTLTLETSRGIEVDVCHRFVEIFVDSIVY